MKCAEQERTRYSGGKDECWVGVAKGEKKSLAERFWT